MEINAFPTKTNGNAFPMKMNENECFPNEHECFLMLFTASTGFPPFISPPNFPPKVHPKSPENAQHLKNVEGRRNVDPSFAESAPNAASH